MGSPAVRYRLPESHLAVTPNQVEKDKTLPDSALYRAGLAWFLPTPNFFKFADVDPKTQKRLKRAPFTQTKTRQDANFRGNPLFQSYVQYKNKPTVHLSLASWILADGRGLVSGSMLCNAAGKAAFTTLAQICLTALPPPHGILSCFIRLKSVFLK